MDTGGLRSIARAAARSEMEAGEGAGPCEANAECGVSKGKGPGVRNEGAEGA